jgi:pyruvate dehydrogenase E2 component (dihydrolipoamide acetyltransferase)
MDFRLPELGEGIADATVVNVAVRPGEKVSAGQTLLEVETDKASVPVPAPAEATVGEVRVKAGDKVKVGQTVLTFAGTDSPRKASAASQPSKATLKSEPKPEPAAKPQATGPKPAAGGLTEIKLPALGEGIEGGTIVAVAVKQGDAVKQGQELLTIETDKASVPMPAPADGTVVELRVKPGDKVNIGAVLAVLSGQKASAPAAGAPKAAATEPAHAVAQEPAPTATATAPPPSKPSAGNGQGNGRGGPPVPAGPATRRLARELGVDLHEITGSARGGRVTIDDVKTFVKKRVTQPAPAAVAAGTPALPPLPDFSKYGPVEKRPVSNLRRKIAENLTLAWHAAPTVTQFDLADITELEAGRKRIVEGLPKGSPKVTMTVLAIKAVVSALKEFSAFNSSLDLALGVQVFKQYFHVGIAVDTERGLVVPVIRDADKKSIRDLAREVAELAEKARAGKLTIEEMRGGTFTITNLGGIGGTAFSPIINYPEVAILGMARSSLQPVVREGKVEARLMLPLCLTYDHRVIDGADGARFTTRLAQLFSDPIRLLMES